MKLIFEESRPGRGNQYLPASSGVPAVQLPENMRRQTPPRLPEVAEGDLSRHYSDLARHTHGLNNGFYPLGSCTMKYNPKIDEWAASLPQFQNIHPLQPKDTVKG